jgi:GPH family glycoside/pentoside/hexuronide:cation symporter
MEENRTSLATNVKPLSNTIKYFYGVGDAGFVLMTNVEAFYWMTCLTDVCGFTPIIAGLINTIYSIVDSCTSWIQGAIINSTKAGKYGRYRSWLLVIPWIVPFLFALEFIRFSENATLSATIIVAASIISHFLWNIPYVANVSLISVVGKTPENKAIMASSRSAWNNIGGIAFSYLGLPFATVLAGVIGEKYMFAGVAFCLGILMAVTYMFHFMMTKGYEQPEAPGSVLEKKNKITGKNLARSLFANPQLLLLMLADLMKWILKFVSSMAAIYYFRDAMQSPALMATYVLLVGVAAVIGAYGTRFIGSRLSNRMANIIGFAGMAVFAFIAFMSYASVGTVITFMAIAFIFCGVSFAATPACYADTVVAATWKTGQDASGWIMGLQNVPLKISLFCRSIIISAALVATNWHSGIVYEGAARQGMTIAFCLVPALACAVGCLILVFGYKLSREKVAQYQAEINARFEKELEKENG